MTAAGLTGTQLSLTTLLHLGVGLPWNFRVGPGTDSEKRHLNDMLDSLPTRSLLLGDAGLFSHELAQNLDESGRYFLLRVGGNRKLLTPGDEKSKVIYHWPKSRERQLPMKLRHIMLTRGKKTIHLVTNVHNEKKLSELNASYLYALRWEQEVYHRLYKPSCAPFAQGVKTGTGTSWDSEPVPVFGAGLRVRPVPVFAGASSTRLTRGAR